MDLQKESVSDAARLWGTICNIRCCVRPDTLRCRHFSQICLGDKHIIQLLDMNVMILISAALCYTIVFQCC